ncbi:MAG: proton-conducting transporter membrane subunit [Planctomycetales bacterium]
MTELHFDWIELAILVPLLGALWVGRVRDPERARRQCLIVAGLALLCAVGAWLDFNALHVQQARDRWDVASAVVGRDYLVIDELSAPLLPLAALLYFMTALATLRTKVRRFSFSWALASEAVLLATLSCREPWGVIMLIALGTIHPWLELRARRRPTRVYALHMALFVGLMIGGWAIFDAAAPASAVSLWGVGMMLAAVLIRSGIAPAHCWMTDLFEHATFGTALLFVTPILGAYAAVRLVLPIAPDWALRSIGILSLATAVYAAGMALAQREARRFFCYLFLSHSALVLVGLESLNPIGLTGGLCVWLSVGISLAGFGLTLRSIESRTGRLSLAGHHGLYEHMPILAAFFLLTGLASIGFPGTIGFVGTELVVEGAVQVYPYVGIAVVIAAALNGIAVVHAYFRLFTGTRHVSSISLRARLPERVAVLALTALILGGGLFPQPGVTSRHNAARKIIAARRATEPPNEGSTAGATDSPKNDSKDFGGHAKAVSMLDLFPIADSIDHPGDEPRGSSTDN